MATTMLLSPESVLGAAFSFEIAYAIQKPGRAFDLDSSGGSVFSEYRGAGQYVSSRHVGKQV